MLSFASHGGKDRPLKEGEIMTDPLTMAKQGLASQPFSRLVGAEVVQFSEQGVEIHIPIAEKHLQQHGFFVHGGVISYAADNALSFAGAIALGPGVVTSEFKINYLRPAVGALLVARSTVIYGGKSQAVCRCDVFVRDEKGERLCATSQGTIAKLSQP
jgi:uncharacterized protein (TIGR00369 family)